MCNAEENIRDILSKSDESLLGMQYFCLLCIDKSKVINKCVI